MFSKQKRKKNDLVKIHDRTDTCSIDIPCTVNISLNSVLCEFMYRFQAQFYFFSVCLTGFPINYAIRLTFPIAYQSQGRSYPRLG